MTVFLHEMRQNRLSIAIWSAVIAFMLSISIVIYPEMATQIGDVSAMLSDMGNFSAAFGMDQINFGEFTGYFGIECGNVLGLGGAFFAALLGISALAKEEKDRTAEFLLTHPLPRHRIITEKLLSLLCQILILNLIVVLASGLCAFIIGENPFTKPILLSFLAYLFLQIELAAITFGISAFLSRGGVGIGLGIAILSYFLNIIANLTEDAAFLKYLTPFGYTDSADVIANEAIHLPYLAVGLIFTVLGVVTAYRKYTKKDIA